MLAAFATLSFLTAIWLAVGTALLTLAGGDNRIIAALKGRSPLAMQPTAAPVALRFSPRARAQTPLRAQPEWRAAA